jgi:hypothetical protein
MQVQTALAEPGEYRRTHLLALIESLRGKATASGPMEETKLDRHRTALSDHLADPATLVIDKHLVQCSGHKPGEPRSG